MKWLPLLILAGCAEPMTQSYPPSREVVWTVVHSKLALHNVCAVSYEQKPSLAACAFQIQESGRCYIYSTWTEDEAKRIREDGGESLWEHEMRHCRGERHP